MRPRLPKGFKCSAETDIDALRVAQITTKGVGKIKVIKFDELAQPTGSSGNAFASSSRSGPMAGFTPAHQDTTDNDADDNFHDADISYDPVSSKLENWSALLPRLKTAYLHGIGQCQPKAELLDPVPTTICNCPGQKTANVTCVFKCGMWNGLQLIKFVSKFNYDRYNRC